MEEIKAYIKATVTVALVIVIMWASFHFLFPPENDEDLWGDIFACFALWVGIEHYFEKYKKQ